MKLRSLILLAALTLCSHAGAWVITRTSDTYLTQDAGTSVFGAYVSFQITNDTGITQTNLWADIGTFTTANLSLAPGEDGNYYLGTLANGQSATAFFYLQTGTTSSASFGATVN